MSVRDVSKGGTRVLALENKGGLKTFCRNILGAPEPSSGAYRSLECSPGLCSKKIVFVFVRLESPPDLSRGHRRTRA